MKTNKFLLGVLAAATLLVVGCAADDTADVTINQGNGGLNPTNPLDLVIGGTLTEDLALVTGTEYSLTSGLIVPDGLTLTIEPGVVVKATTGSDVYVAIQQGGTIIAEGTSSNPIVFTSDSATPNPGDWGGLIVLGRAPINSVVGGDASSTSEIGGLPYGGSLANDNSGIIRYVRIEYSGGAADAASENNGFSFYAVGSGTTIDFIQAFEGADDGVEFFGGTVNASHISVVGAQDDSVDWTEGFTGTLTDVYIEHRQSHDKGIEGDGFNTDIGNNSNPVFWSAPTINNLTINGLGSSNGNEAIRLRAGTRAIFNNVFIEGFEEGYDLDDEETGNGFSAGDTSVNDITFDDIVLTLKNDTNVAFDADDFFSNIGNGTGADYDSWNSGWTRN
ncbi:MAG: multidrug transporter [Winogradskyella sp.]|uniref:multidrug transporter n=1 Tax=Winogradskyella sp. TaxID=1883156 RepID=UPI00180A7864|nr:multidrug transporter [Winogradskyella sp.]MBT8245292.1 multidrug transporter [Winogradskyella sp.]NNK23287.1 multidrug transporter [Winogradskyella sp.]